VPWGSSGKPGVLRPSRECHLEAFENILGGIFHDVVQPQTPSSTPFPVLLLLLLLEFSLQKRKGARGGELCCMLSLPTPPPLVMPVPVAGGGI
jgi:hypothetical protein